MNADLAERLTKNEREQRFAYLRPKDAATLILIDRSGPTFKVLMGRRHNRHAFLPGKFVFPGGRVEVADRRVPATGALNPQDEARLIQRVARASRLKARAFAVAAIREAFEETGLMIGRKVDAPPALPEAWVRFAQANVQPDIGALHFVARAITPPGRPRRFDTRFFAADALAIAHRVESVVGPDAELVELIWVPLAQAQELGLATITRLVLIDLAARIAAGFAHELPVPYYRAINGRHVRELL
ncbi:MAG TPA: NUDIX hydrolase [Xanthobacteraceae bacterium]|nr:NUDIX hydrolase [Xanthobacteraceae bacterium]